MSFIVNDNFQSYQAGPNQLPNGFSTDGIVFESTMIDADTQRPPAPSVGFYEHTGIYYSLFGNIRLDFGNFEPYTTVCWLTLGDGTVSLTPGLIELHIVEIIEGVLMSDINIAQVLVELDGTISINVPGVAKVNTLIPLWYFNTWQYFQYSAQIDATNISVQHPNGLIRVTSNLAVDGLLTKISNSQQISNIDVPTWASPLGINRWVVVGNPNGQYFGELVITDDEQSLPYFPNKASTINARTSEVITEVIEKPLRNARVSQAVTELVKQPTNNVRSSQMIVELILKGGSANQGAGFYVRES